jgi:hypothetical protein
MVNGVEYSQSLQYGGKFKIVETGEVIATAYPVPSQRNFCIDLNLSIRESPSEGFLKRISQARQAALSILPIESKIQLLHQKYALQYCASKTKNNSVFPAPKLVPALV